jgi:ectoine hydroxylase-related dioxygenase (phytanoyl-CoA dioxygenase family)
MTPAMRAATTSVEEVTGALERDGYAVVEGMLSPQEVRVARDDVLRLLQTTPTGRNDFEGFSTRRVYALFAKTRVFDGPATHPLVLGVLDNVLESYQLSAPQAIQIGPGETAQSLHRDDGVYPIARPHPELVVNTMWALDDFTEANGATHVVPGSHKWVDQRPDASTPSLRAVMPAGSVMFFLGSVYHGGGANMTDRPRLGVILEYVAGWLRQQENQYLAVPREVARALPQRLQELLGYNIHGNLVGNVDGRHPLKVLMGG